MLAAKPAGGAVCRKLTIRRCILGNCELGRSVRNGRKSVVGQSKDVVGRLGVDELSRLGMLISRVSLGVYRAPRLRSNGRHERVRSSHAQLRECCGFWTRSTRIEEHIGIDARFSV